MGLGGIGSPNTKKSEFVEVDMHFEKYFDYQLHNKKINALTTNISNDVISTCSDDGYVKIFSIVGRKELYNLYCNNNLPISMDFHPHNPDLFLTGHNHNLAQVWSLRKGRPRHTFQSHSESVTTCKFYEDAKCFTGSSDRTIRLMDIVKGNLISTLMCISGCYASATDGFAIYSGHNDGKIKVWTEHKNQPILEHKVHDGRINYMF